jgi:uncharacterized protein
MDSKAFRSKYGPWALVTGASSGIGQALATRLAELGLSVVLVARREATLQQHAQDLIGRFGVQCRVVATDLSSDASADEIASATRDLDVGLLVAAAGFGTSGQFVDNDIAEELAMIRVNCAAVAELTHAFARRFVSRGRGGIVLLSSIAAFQGVPRAANYAATKAYVQSLAEGLHDELEPLGVDVLACAPGPVSTGFGDRAGMAMSVAQEPEEIARKTLGALGRRVTVRPGFLSKALEGGLALMPRRWRVNIVGLIMAEMTDDDPD